MPFDLVSPAAPRCGSESSFFWRNSEVSASYGCPSNFPKPFSPPGHRPSLATPWQPLRCLPSVRPPRPLSEPQRSLMFLGACVSKECPPATYPEVGTPYSCPQASPSRSPRLNEEIGYATCSAGLQRAYNGWCGYLRNLSMVFWQGEDSSTVFAWALYCETNIQFQCKRISNAC